MERFLVDFSVNVYETVAGFALILSMYRFSLKGHAFHIVIAAIAMAQTSFLLREIFNWGDFTPLFMLLWIVILLWRLFQIHLYFSLLMAVSGYLVYIAIQFLFYLMLQTFFSTEDILGSFTYSKMIQVVSSTITLSISFFLIKRRLGFSFVPDRVNESIELNGINRLLLYTIIGACILVSSAAYKLIDGILLVWIGAIAIITMFIIFNLSYMKERKS